METKILTVFPKATTLASSTILLTLATLFTSLLSPACQPLAAEEFRGGSISVPRSFAKIEGSLTIPDQSGTYEFSVLDGGTLRIEDDESGVTYALVFFHPPKDIRPEVKAQLENSDIGVAIHRIEAVGETHEKISYLSTVGLKVGRKAKQVGPEGFLLDIREIGDPDQLTISAPPISDYYDNPSAFKSLCCISCDGYTICGCEISGSCGSCSGSCGGGGTPAQDWKLPQGAP